MHARSHFSRLLHVCLFATTATAVLHTADPASANPAHTWRAALDGSPGWIETRYGMSDASRCLADTSGYYGSDRIAGQTGLGVVHSYKTYEVKGNDCLTLNRFQPNEHLEGMARIAVPGREFLYFSYMNGGTGSNYSSVVRVDVRASETLTPEGFLLPQTDGRDAELMFCKKATNSPHVGGLQALGDYLFAGVEENGANARVDVYRVKDGNTMRDNAAVAINSVRMRTGTQAHYVLATRLVDGKYLMAVNRNNGGTFSLFWANDPMGTWEYINDQVFPDKGAWSTSGERYQSANFITDCSGKLYIAALGQTLDGTGWTGANEVFMYAVDLRRDVENRPQVNGLAEVGFFRKDSSNNKCQMRGAGATHITPSGRLSLYCGPDREFEVNGHDFYFTSVRPPE